MPGKGRPPGGSPLDPFFDYLRGLGSQGPGYIASRIADAVLPTCCDCGERAYLAAPCIRCGRYSCPRHGYFNVTSQTSVCPFCADEIDTGAASRARAEMMEEEGATREDYPWCILEMEPTWEESEVQRAYRRQAGKYHPDAVGGDPQMAEAFKVLTRARDEALTMIREG